MAVAANTISTARIILMRAIAPAGAPGGYVAKRAVSLTVSRRVG
jgi:hypothetical protein